MTNVVKHERNEKGQIKKGSGGRPPGAKNKTTIFKEVMREGFEKKLLTDGMKVVNAVVAKALDGDMTAAKLLLDRILPTSKAIDLNELEKSKGLTISINVGSMEKQGEVIDADVIRED